LTATAHLKDWELVVDRQGVEKLAIGMTDNPFQNTIATNFGFGFTNTSTGGCGKANVNLMGQSASYMAGLDLLPDDRLLIRLQCGDEADLLDRYVGVLRKVDTAYGTDPQVRKLEATGIFGQFRKVPLLLFYDAKTVIQIAQGVIADLATKTDITSYSTYIDYGSYEIAQTDFLDHYADKAIKRLATIAGPDCIFGVVPGDSATPTDARFYFTQLGDTAVDPGFEVEDTIEEAEGYITRDRILNGMLVSCQRKIGGGDLWLYIPPADGTIPHRIKTERIPEIVAPTDAYEWANAKLEGQPINDQRISFKVPGFGKQVWANEIMDAPLSVLLQPGGTPVEIKCLEYSLSVDGSGTVDSQFSIGSMPDMHLANLYGDLYRETLVAQAREFWSGAELAARDSDFIREARRHAAQTHGIRNIWGTNLDNIESILTDEGWADGDFEEPAAFPDYGWDYDADKQRTIGSGANGTIAIVPIPSGLTAGAAIVYLKTGGASYWQADSEHWVRNENTEPNATWEWWSDWFGIRPHLYSIPTNTWRMGVTCNYKYSSGVPESPIRVWMGPMEKLDDATNPTTYGAMKTLAHYYDIIFAATTTDPTTASGFCLRMHRRSGDTAGNVAVALGWVSAGTFHSNWWDAGATPDAQTVGTVCLGTDAAVWTGTHSFELDVWLPSTGGSGEFRVKVRKNRTAEVLWDSSDIHGDGEVSGSAPDPEGDYYVMCAYYEPDPDEQEDYTCGIKNVDIQSPGGIGVAVTRDGEYWTTGNVRTLLTLFGDTYLDGERQLMFAVNLGEGNSLSSWAVGFTHETPAAALAWDDNFGDEGTGNGEFKQPRDCSVDHDYIYVSDYNNDRVQRLTNTDPPVYSAQFGTTGTGDANFDKPWGIDHDNTYLYIADSSNKRIKVHLKASPYTFIRSIGSGTLTHALRGCTITGRTYSGSDLVYVTDNNGWVWIFQKDGTYVSKFEPFSDHTPPNNICDDVTLSGDEAHLYCTSPGGSATDDPTNCIRKIKRESPYTAIWTWGQRGLDPVNGKWEWPWAVCRLGDLLIVSSGASGAYPAKNYLTILADRGNYAEYLDHVNGLGGESGAGFLQAYAGDIRDNIIYVCETGYCQLKRFTLS